MTVELAPPAAMEKKSKPYFMWNSELSENDIRSIIAGQKGELEKVQMIAHIMQNARFEDIWEYLQVGDIVINWLLIKRMLWPKESSELWGWALRLWGWDVQYP